MVSGTLPVTVIVSPSPDAVRITDYLDDLTVTSLNVGVLRDGTFHVDDFPNHLKVDDKGDEQKTVWC